MSKVFIRTLLLTALILVSGMTIGSCGGGEYRAELLRAEAMLDSLPDTAMILVSGVPRDRLRSSADIALRDLIEAEAEYNLYIEHPEGDSMLALAEEKFRSAGDSRRLMRTLFQRSIKQFYAEDYSESLISAIKVLDIAEELSDDEYIAKAADIMSTNYNYNYNHREALRCIDRVIDACGSAGMTAQTLFAKIDRGIILSDLRRYGEAVALLDSLTLTYDGNDSLLIMYSCLAKIDPLLALGHTRRANDVMDSLVRFSHPRAGVDPRIKLDVLVASGKYDAAKALIDTIKAANADWPHDKRVMESILKYQIGVGQTDSALAAATEIAELQRQGISRVFDNGLEHAKAKFRETQLKESRAMNLKMRLMMFLALGAALLLTAAGFVFHRYQMKKRIDAMDSRLAEISEVFSLQSRRLSSIFGDRVNMINGLCESYFSEKGVQEAMRAKIYRDVCGVLKQLNSKASMENIERFINDSQDGAVDKLNAIPGISPTGRLVAIYTFLGLTPKAIAILCDTGLGNIYTVRTRLREAIANSGSEYASALTEKLNRKS